MDKLQALWTKDPGFVVSGGVHVLALVLLLVNFSSAPPLDDAVESVPVEMITTSDMNKIMNGEETAKQLPTPQRRVDTLAEVEEHKPTPPLAEAKKDTPPPPSPEKANDDPGQDEKPPEKVAALPPPPPPEPVVPTPPVPTPPERPVEKAEAPKPAPRPDPVKPPPPPEAEAVEPTPPPRPKVEKEAKQEPKPVPVPHPRPVETKEAKVVPPPPRKPEPAKKTDPKMLDQVAKLLEDMKPPKPVTKQKTGNEAKDAKHNDFSLDKITALLDHEAPQHKASTGRSLAQVASLGLPNSHADKMSPSMMAQLDGWLIDHYRGCWSYFGLGATQDYVPSVRVKMAEDGSLIGLPQLLNPPSDPNLRSLADSAIRAVNRCNPMAVPDRFKPYYDSWRQRVVRFDPKEMS